MDIPEREHAERTKKQSGPMRPPQGAKFLPCEFRSGVAATLRLWTEYHSGASSLSRIGTERRRAASEKTCRGKVLFQHSQILTVHRIRASARGERRPLFVVWLKAGSRYAAEASLGSRTSKCPLTSR